jgi:DNA-binding NarL/FixJ family response regulator
MSGNGRPLRLAIVDDHPIARYGVEQVFDSCNDVAVVCSAGSLAELAGSAADPDVIILDLYLGGPGRVATASIADLTRRCPVLVMSASALRADALAAIRAGAAGYLVKQATGDSFREAVATVAAGGFYLSPQLADLIDADRQLGRVRSALAPREEETLRYIAQGFTQAQAAARMGVSAATVDTYIKRIRGKLGVGNKADLTRIAMDLDQPGHRGTTEQA